MGFVYSCESVSLERLGRRVPDPPDCALGQENEQGRRRIKRNGGGGHHQDGHADDSNGCIPLRSCRPVSPDGRSLPTPVANGQNIT